MGAWSMLMTLSISKIPSTLSCAPASPKRRAGPGERPVQDVVDERGLPGAGDARHRRHDTEREDRVDALQVVLARAANDDRLSAAGAPALGDRDRPLARQVLPRQRLRKPLALLGRALADEPPAVEPRARAEVDDPVRRADGLLVVLDHDDGVADVAHRDQRVDQLAVVALVQADGRLVEHVEHAHELGADLRRELDALRLAARERRRAAGEVEVPDPDVREKAEPVLDLLEILPAISFALRQLKSSKRR
jgi:hypothetical protein